MAYFSAANLMIVFIATLNLVQSSLGTNYIVGDESGWNTGVDYFSWTIGKTFFVGDNLVFRYKKGLHNVFDVNITAFSECATPANQAPLESGNDVVPLLHPGTKWFICSIDNHCESDQKLIIQVENPPPSFSLPPSPLPSLQPPTAAAPAPSPQFPFPSESPESQSPVPSVTAPPL